MTETNTIAPTDEPQAHGRKKRGGLFVTDAELIEKLNVPEKIAREAIKALDAQRSGFPQKQRLWGDRRYWPAVRAYLDAICGGKLITSQGRGKND